MKSNESRPFLFILGNPRSGTTLLRLALSTHSGICIPPECGFALLLADKFGDSKFPEAEDDFFKAVVACKKFETWRLTIKDIYYEASLSPPSTYAEACKCVYRAFARMRGKVDALPGDKNNFYTDYIEGIAAHFPESRVIWIVRDPRDVFCSYLELGSKKIDSPYAPILAQNTTDF